MEPESRSRNKESVMGIKKLLHLLRLLTLDGKELVITLKVWCRNLVSLKIKMLKLEWHFNLRELEHLKLNIHQLESQLNQR